MRKQILSDLSRPINNKKCTHSSLIAFLAEYGSLGAAVLSYLEDVEGSALSEAKDLLEKRYCGAFRNKNAFVKAEYKRTQKEPLKDSTDYEILANHWFMYTYFALAVEGEEHVFERKKVTEKR